MSDDACRRAREALASLCSGESTQSHANTLYMEAVVEQGRQVQPSDVDEISHVFERASEMFRREEGQALKFHPRRTVCVPGTERVDPDNFHGLNPENRVHCFFVIDSLQIAVNGLETGRKRIASMFQRSEASTGRGLRGIYVVDEDIVQRSVPELVGPPMEDTELL